MKEVTKKETIKALKEGKIIYLKGSSYGQERFYRLADDQIEYSDDNKLWKKSSAEIGEFEYNEWIIYK